MRSFKQDYQQGIEHEQRIKPILESHYNQSLTKLGQYDCFDFKSDQAYFELKTRTLASTRFDTTIIPKSKINVAKQLTKDIYLIFQFTDGLYSIQYNTSLFDTFQSSEYQRPDRQDHTDTKQMYTFIPIQHLQKIH